MFLQLLPAPAEPGLGGGRVEPRDLYKPKAALIPTALKVPDRFRFPASAPLRTSMRIEIYFVFFIRSSEQIIQRNIKIIRKPYKSVVVRLPLSVFVSADTVLVHIQVKSELQLRNSSFFSQRSESKFHFYDHGFRTAKASFFAELGLVLRSKIAIAPMAKATKRV